MRYRRISDCDREKLQEFDRPPISIISPDDETADSALARLARRNGCRNTRILVNRISGLEGLDWSTRDAKCILAAKLTGRTLPSVSRSTPFIVRGIVEIGRLRGHGSRDKVSFCPTCLRYDRMRRESSPAEGPYVRGMWHFSMLRYCHRHAVRLLLECPRCARSTDFHSIIGGTCRCGQELTNLQPNALDWDDYNEEFERLSRGHLANLFRNPKNAKNSQPIRSEMYFEAMKTLEEVRQQTSFELFTSMPIDDQRNVSVPSPFPEGESGCTPKSSHVSDYCLVHFARALTIRLMGRDQPNGALPFDEYPPEVRNKLLRLFEEIETNLCAI